MALGLETGTVSRPVLEMKTHISCRVLGCLATDPVHYSHEWVAVCYHKSLPHALGICPQHAGEWERWEWRMVNEIDERLPDAQETARPPAFDGLATESEQFFLSDEHGTSRKRT